MIGLGVGIDYALFLTTRFRQRIADGDEPVRAAGSPSRPADTRCSSPRRRSRSRCSGSMPRGSRFIGQLGLAAVFTVVTAAAAALTLVPAGLGLAGRRIDRLAVRRPVAEAAGESDGWYRYAHVVARRPWRFLAARHRDPRRPGAAAAVDQPRPHRRRRRPDELHRPARLRPDRAAASAPGANGQFTVVVDTRTRPRRSRTIAQQRRERCTRPPDVAHASAAEAVPERSAARRHGRPGELAAGQRDARAVRPAGRHDPAAGARGNRRARATSPAARRRSSSSATRSPHACRS